MQKQYLLHAVGVMALSLLCACGTAQEEAPKTAPAEQTQAPVTPAEESKMDDKKEGGEVAQNDGSPEGTTQGAEAVATTAENVPAPDASQQAAAPAPAADTQEQKA